MAHHTTTAEQIASQLDRAKPTKDGWIACCPAHDDTHPSLSLTDRDGKVLVKCFAGCSQEAVVDALRRRGLWPKPGTGLPRTTIHTYRYADSTPAFHVHRTDSPDGSKKIAQKLPDGQWRAHPAPRPLFNLPDILSNSEKPVLVVEGEKVVVAATEQFPEYVVTTSAGGSQAAKRSDWSPLKDRDVLICPDNDSPGERYGEDVARLVEEAGARHIQVHKPPPDLPTGWDLADPVPEGFTLPSLEEWAKAEPPATPARGFKRTPWSEFKYQESERVEWILDGLLRRGGMSLLVSAPKVGKSKLARNITRAVLLGLDCLGRMTTPGPVIYMALDEGDVPPREHFKRMGLPDDAPLEMVTEKEPEGALRKLAEMIEDVQPVLVVVDLLIDLIPIRDINEYGQVIEKLQPLLDITRKSNAHVLLLHHARKGGGSHGEEVLGSTGLAGKVDITLSLKRGDHYRSISSSGRSDTHLENLVLRLDEATGLIDVAGTKAEVDTERIGQEILAFLEGQAGPVPREEIEAGIEARKKYIQAALPWLVEQGKIGRSGTGKRGDKYQYFSSSPATLSSAESVEGREEANSSNSEGLGSQNVASSLPPGRGGEEEKKKQQMPISVYVSHLGRKAREEATKELIAT